MELKKQVCPLELSQKLRALGVKQESLFDWCEIDDRDWMVFGRREPEEIPVELDVVSAFTVAELGEMLPDCVKIKGDVLFLRYSRDKQDGNHWAEYAQYDNKDANYDALFIGESEAEARAKMLVYLLENNLIKK